MSLFDAGFFISVYSLFVVCIAELNLNSEHGLLRPARYLQNQYGNIRNYSQPFPNPISATKIDEGYDEVKDWTKEPPKLGQVSGVCLDSKGFVYTFHRGDRVWGSQTFDDYNKLTFSEKQRGPITNFTIVVYNPATGEAVQQWGKNIFYMPHGITVDQDNNVWVTDVGLHQMFKFAPLKSQPKTAELTLGEAFVPGSDSAHFCKPTSIAITTRGDFFVADGYCNSRILKFDSRGVKLLEWGRAVTSHGMTELPNYAMTIPHALVLVEEKNIVCTADRENGRVLCFNYRNGTFAFKMQYTNIVGHRLFAVTYSSINGGIFAVVNGPEDALYSKRVCGFIISAQTRQVVFRFGSNLRNPHSVAISSDGKEIYVAELDPFKLRKYQSNQNIESSLHANISATTKSAVVAVTTAMPPPGGILPAVLVTAAALMFAGALLIAALVYSKARRKGRRRFDDDLYLETSKLVPED